MGVQQQNIPGLGLETHVGASQANQRGEGVKKQGPFRKERWFHETKGVELGVGSWGGGERGTGSETTGKASFPRRKSPKFLLDSAMSPERFGSSVDVWALPSAEESHAEERLVGTVFPKDPSAKIGAPRVPCPIMTKFGHISKRLRCLPSKNSQPFLEGT